MAWELLQILPAVVAEGFAEEIADKWVGRELAGVAVGIDMAADKWPVESSQREKAVIVGEFVVAASSRMGFSPLWMIRLISTYYSCLYSLKWHFFD